MRALASHSTSVTFTRASSRDDPVVIVKAVLDQPDSELDYAQAKLAFDQIIEIRLIAAPSDPKESLSYTSQIG